MVILAITSMRFFTSGSNSPFREMGTNFGDSGGIRNAHLRFFDMKSGVAKLAWPATSGGHGQGPSMVGISTIRPHPPWTWANSSTAATLIPPTVKLSGMRPNTSRVGSTCARTR